MSGDSDQRRQGPLNGTDLEQRLMKLDPRKSQLSSSSCQQDAISLNQRLKKIKSTGLPAKPHRRLVSFAGVSRTDSNHSDLKVVIQKITGLGKRPIEGTVLPDEASWFEPASWQSKHSTAPTVHELDNDALHQVLASDQERCPSTRF